VVSGMWEFGSVFREAEGSVERSFAVVGERARSVSGGEKDGMKKIKPGVQWKEGRKDKDEWKEGRKEGSWSNPFLFLFGDFRDFFSFLLSFALLWRGN